MPRNMWLLMVLVLIESAHAQNIGEWSGLIDFGLVPVAAAVIPQTGKLLTWSAYSATNYLVGYSNNYTQTATYDPSDGSVTRAVVTASGADAFCPGINMDFGGRLIITGGDTPNKTSIVSSGDWQAGPLVRIPRGYQASTTLSDGRSFMIGGSWSGADADRTGEVFDGKNWTKLPGCDVNKMLTQDPERTYRSDNHGMLFSWSDATVFQAGPSKQMNWYYTSGTGSVTSAGNRGDDRDAMCGTAAMYDATAGQILVAGGAPVYDADKALNLTSLTPEEVDATANAHLVTISQPGTQPQVAKLSPMKYSRTYATSTILPDGSVLITGGQAHGVPFSDDTSVLTPELWNPATQMFTDMAPHSTPRNYHSVAVLMPDGTVFHGGGGLCGNNCPENHLNGEIFSPPYLFESDGKTRAPRPNITDLSAESVKVGGTFTVTMDSSDEFSFALVRYGSSTHTVNTDQRRVPLSATGASSGTSFVFQLPQDPGVVLPGYWHFFAMRNGVPSMAKRILVELQ